LHVISRLLYIYYRVPEIARIVFPFISLRQRGHLSCYRASQSIMQSLQNIAPQL